MDDLKNLWQTQEVVEMKFTVEELRAKAAKFQRRIRRRNLREYLAAMIVAVWAGVACWNIPQFLPRIAFACIVAGAIYYAWHLWRWGSATPAPAEMGAADSFRFYRHELQRQRDLVSGVWKWAVMPIMPGLILLAAYNVAVAPSPERWKPVVSALLQAALISVVVWLNMRAAQRLDRRIAELDQESGAA